MTYSCWKRLGADPNMVGTGSRYSPVWFFAIGAIVNGIAHPMLAVVSQDISQARSPLQSLEYWV